MSSTFGAALLTISLATGGMADEKSVLPQPVIKAGLKKAGCTMAPGQAQIVGTEWLSSRLQIVEVACWRAAYNTGSILFAVPDHRPQNAELLPIDTWKDGRVRRTYSVPSLGFDPKTRTLSSTFKARGAGDCGTIQEMKWTGWHFRLLKVWAKDSCDGELFEWDSRDKWQVYPRRGLEHDPDGPSPKDENEYASR